MNSEMKGDQDSQDLRGEMRVEESLGKSFMNITKTGAMKLRELI